MVPRGSERFPQAEERPMPDKTYKMIELVGVSEDSIQQAIRNAVARASQSLKGLDWFEMTEVRGLVKEGKVSEFQVKVKVGFRILSENEMQGA
jgi:dodecin